MNRLNVTKTNKSIETMLKKIDYVYKYNNDKAYVERCRKYVAKVEERLLVEMGFLDAVRLINKTVKNINGYNFVEMCPDLFPNFYDIERAIKKRKINDESESESEYDSEVDDCESDCSCSDCASDFSESDCSEECESDCNCSDCEEEYDEDSEESEESDSESEEMASDGDSDDTHYRGENKRISKKEMNKRILLENYHYDLERVGLLERRSNSKSTEKLKEVILDMEKNYKKLDDKRVKQTIKELKNKYC